MAYQRAEEQQLIFGRYIGFVSMSINDELTALRAARSIGISQTAQINDVVIEGEVPPILSPQI